MRQSGVLKALTAYEQIRPHPISIFSGSLQEGRRVAALTDAAQVVTQHGLTEKLVTADQRKKEHTPQASAQRPLHQLLAAGSTDFDRVLTSFIKKTSSWHELQSLVQQNGQHFNAIHVSALVCHLPNVLIDCLQEGRAADCTAAAGRDSGATASTSKSSGSGHRQQQCRPSPWPTLHSGRAARNAASTGGTAIETSPQLNRFLGDVSQMVEVKLVAFDARGLANVLWAVARLGFVPSEGLLNRLLFEAYLRLPDMKPQELSNVGWALATMHLCPAAAWVDKYMHAVLPAIPHMRPQELSNCIWALKELGAVPPVEIVAAASTQAVRSLSTIKASELITLIKALQQLASRLPRASVAAAATPMSQACMASTGVPSAAVCAAPSSTGIAIEGGGAVPCTPAACGALTAAISSRVPGGSSKLRGPRLLSPTHHACGYVDLALLRLAAGWLVQHAAKLNAQDHSNWLLVLARLPARSLQHLPSGHLHAMLESSRLHLHEATPQCIANSLWAVATMQLQPDPIWLRTVLMYFRDRLPTANGQALANVSWALARLQVRPPARWLQALAAEATLKLPSFTCQEVVNTAWALARLGASQATAADEGGHRSNGTARLRLVTQVAGSSLINNASVAGSVAAGDPHVQELLRGPPWSAQPAGSSTKGNGSEVAEEQRPPCGNPLEHSAWAQALKSEALQRLTRLSAHEFVMLLHGLAITQGTAAAGGSLAASCELQAAMHMAVGQGRLQGTSSRALAIATAATAQLLATQHAAHGEGCRASLPEGWLLAMESAMLAQLDNMGAADAAILLAGLANLGLRPNEALITGLLRQAVARRHDLAPQDVVGLLRALHQLRFRPPSHDLEVLMRAAAQQLADFTPQQLSVMAWAIGRLRFRPTCTWCEQLQRAAHLQRHRFSVLQLTRLLWGLVRMGAKLYPRFVTGILAAFKAQQVNATPGETTTLLFSIMRLPPNLLLRRGRKAAAAAVRHCVAPQLPKFSPRQRDVVIRAADLFALRARAVQQMRMRWGQQRQAGSRQHRSATHSSSKSARKG